MTVTALVLQTWFDISITHTGSVENAFVIALANGGRSVTDDIAQGEVLIIPAEALVLKKIVAVLESKNAISATGITATDLEAINPVLGIGTMTIGSTFIVG